ncbi:hypothetical protein ACC704_37035, partial [Rhizobium johnstonii]
AGQADRRLLFPRLCRASPHWSGWKWNPRSGSDLPDLPEKFSAVRVTFPPNDLHELGKGSKEDLLDAFRADKGRRVLSGMLTARDSRFFMIVDDD